ncbi:hypothetical protein [Agrobacterium tumefaciens]|uniref:hypothetical protein n=1 Tax=Agrobacterium tumefaciens TaxID=358 RepID=UPI001572D5BB|nr:hypothetical protein [Agrobacterium tumefaciens]WCJ62809.1 hypothetical protein G6M15_00985 [Agrobacterium tumefaciens]
MAGGEDDLGLILDQRRRRATEIRAAARAYVRECGRQREVIDLEQWGQHRWRRDGDIKRRIMCDALRDEVAQGVAVVDVWQRFEVSGSVARRLVGARSFGDLYRTLMANDMPIGFRPGDIARWVSEGRMSAEDGRDIVGIESVAEFDAFLAAWSAGES